MIAVVDYGAGNVQSVVNGLEFIDADAVLTTDPAVIDAAAGVIVPGVGAARDTMQSLTAAGLVPPVLRAVSSGRPFLGICMGMQALMTYSDEHGGQPCLDVIPGVARRLATDLAVPHMGWNGVLPVGAGVGHPLLDGLPPGADVYFAHSFACFPDSPGWVLAETDYGERFPCIVGRDNVLGVQFHPEKSGVYGLRLLENFLAIVEAGGVAARRAAAVGR